MPGEGVVWIVGTGLSDENGPARPNVLIDRFLLKPLCAVPLLMVGDP